MLYLLLIHFQNLCLPFLLSESPFTYDLQIQLEAPQGGGSAFTLATTPLLITTQHKHFLQWKSVQTHDESKSPPAVKKCRSAWVMLATIIGACGQRLRSRSKITSARNDESQCQVQPPRFSLVQEITHGTMNQNNFHNHAKAHQVQSTEYGIKAACGLNTDQADKAASHTTCSTNYKSAHNYL